MKSNKARVILVIGPSGVGKSTITKRVAEELGYKYINLDDEARVHEDSEYPSRGVEIVETLESKGDGEVYIIDVGAGFQAQKGLSEFFQSRKNHLFCVYTTPNTAYARNTGRIRSYWRDKTIEAYKQSEYSEDREKLYALGKKLINDEQDKAVEELKTILSNIDLWPKR